MINFNTLTPLKLVGQAASMLECVMINFNTLTHLSSNLRWHEFSQFLSFHTAHCQSCPASYLFNILHICSFRQSLVMHHLDSNLHLNDWFSRCHSAWAETHTCVYGINAKNVFLSANERSKCICTQVLVIPCCHGIRSAHQLVCNQKKGMWKRTMSVD